MRLWVLAVLGYLVGSGCAGGGARPIAGSQPRATAEEPTEVERHPYAELMAPPAAGDAASPGLWIRVNNVAQLQSKLPSSVQSHPALEVYKDLSMLVSAVLGADVGAVIDLSQPIDVAMAIPRGFEKPAPVVAFRVRSPATIERGQAGLTLRHLAAGMWLLGDEPPQPSPVEPDESAMDDDEEAPDDEEDGEALPEGPSESRLPCVLAHAPPPVGYRVLCGEQLSLVRALSAFLLRDAPAPAADLHGELGGPAYRALVDQALTEARAEGKAEIEAQTGSEKLGAEIGLAIIETLGAHERIGLDIRLGATGVEATLDVAFPELAATAGLQQWARSVSERRLPGGFALLPTDNAFALSFAGLGEQAMRSFASLLLGELSTEMAQEFVLSAAQLNELTESFVGMFPSDAHFSVAAGSDLTAIEKVLNGDAVRQADEAGRPLTPAAIKDLQAALAGWVTVGFELPPKDYLPAVERMLRADAIPMRRRPGMPRKDSDREDTTLRKRPVTTRGLPAGTLHIVEQVRPAKTYRPPVDGSEPPVLPYDAHWLVVPDGPRVWAVGARNEAMAGRQALLALQTSARLGPQARAAERPLLGAWSFNLSGMRLQSLDWNSVSERHEARRQLRRYGTQLRGAKTPMLITLAVAPPLANGAPGFGFRAQLHVNQAALTELIDGIPGGAVTPVPP
jgi:hypothetical protein